MLDDLCVGTLAPDLQLIDGSCTEGVRCREQHGFPLSAIIGTQLPNRRRLSDTVRTNHEQHRRSLFRHVKCVLTLFKDANNFLFQKRNQILRGTDLLLLDALAYPCDERLRRLYAHIRHQQGLLEIIDEFIVNIGISDDKPFNIMREVLACFRQAFFEPIKESHNNSFLCYAVCSAS